MQVRHIPPILEFLSDKSPQDYHIWGFEEPENSLELANAITEAETFRGMATSANKQVFLTSHSPAFFSLKGPEVKRYFVSRSEERTNRLTSTVHMIDMASPLPGELMGETPHLPIISEYLRTAHEEIQRQRVTTTELVAQVQAQELPIVFVEGESDKLIFEKAWAIYVGQPLMVAFESAGGTTKMESLGRDGPILVRLAPQRKVFALVDNDMEGRSVNENGRLAPGGKWVQHNSNKVMWCRLPFEREFQMTMQRLNIHPKHWPGSLENLFPTALRQRALDAGALQFTDRPHAELCHPEIIPKITQYLQPRADLAHMYMLTPAAESKETFAHWIVGLADEEPAILEPLQPLLQAIADHVGKH